MAYEASSAYVSVTRAKFITRSKEFGKDPAKHGFSMEYHGAKNSCIDFTWDALNKALLHRKTKDGLDKNFEGNLSPVDNVDDIKSIPAPMPKSELNKEHSNPKPEQQWWQKVIGEAQPPGEQVSPLQEATQLARVPPTDPLYRQAEEAVRRLEQGLGREYDDNSARLAASSAYLAKEHGLSRIDHVVLSENYKSVRQGENLFVVEGALNDPAHKMAHMKTNDAIAQPVEQSLAQLQSLGETQRQQQSQQQEQQRDQSITPPPRMV
ncbi:XVIPCD domain-containing protein [Xanthomonas sp. 3058]|uniref:XVIPCD domain-containing protein n=1 Tax=Xanthomonas sp. 3058 TaxID=3035314 RepID=UPI0016141C78|nr:XVIPCD domain-containing protein [Xanthomonas sp. 3058]